MGERSVRFSEQDGAFFLVLLGRMLVFVLQVIDPTGILKTQLEVWDAFNS
jgi:hypothetical protein